MVDAPIGGAAARFCYALLESSPEPPGHPHSFHSFSQFQIPDATSFDNENPS
jgi:hypothetical protein